MLVELSVMEQRYQAVLAVVQDGWRVVEVAERLGVSRQSVHAWIAATAIRVLVHDTSASRSLLGQLGVKDSLRFVDTSNAPVGPSEPGLLTWTMNAGLAAIRVGGSPYVALLGERDRLDPKPFDDWWTSTILHDHRSVASRPTSFHVETSCSLSPISMGSAGGSDTRRCLRNLVEIEFPGLDVPSR